MARTRSSYAEKRAGPISLCSTGLGWGRKQGLEPHAMRFQATYDDPTRGLKGVRLDYQEAKAAYTCRRCGESQGCAVCCDDVAGLICKSCHDWANDVSERVHGRMVRSPELKREGMRLVLLVYQGKITQEEFERGWKGACDFMRGAGGDDK